MNLKTKDKEIRAFVKEQELAARMAELKAAEDAASTAAAAPVDDTTAAAAAAAAPIALSNEENEDATDMMLGLFGDPDEDDEYAQPGESSMGAKAPPVVLIDCKYPASFTGPSPKELLQETVKRSAKTKQRSLLEFRKLEGTAMHRYAAVVDGVAYEMKPGHCCKTRREALNLASCVALYSLMSSQSVYMRLPPPFRDMWVSWLEDDALREAKLDEEASRKLNEFIAALVQDMANVKRSRTAESKVSEEVKGAAVASRRKRSAPADSGPSSQYAARLWRKRVASSADYKDMLLQRKELPAYQAADEIVSCIARNAVTIVMGETGCGKSTQVPQLIVAEALRRIESDDAPCHVLCTQPRRISATSLASRVSAEMADAGGPGSKDSICGYQIRGERRVSSTTCITYCTTGIVLKMLQGEERATLPRVTHVVVDEVHERSVQSDLLLALLKVLVSTNGPI